MGLPARIREYLRGRAIHGTLVRKTEAGGTKQSHEGTGCRKKWPPQHRAIPVCTCNNSRMRPLRMYVAMLYGNVSRCKQNRQRRPVGVTGLLRRIRLGSRQCATAAFDLNRERASKPPMCAAKERVAHMQKMVLLGLYRRDIIKANQISLTESGATLKLVLCGSVEAWACLPA